MVQLKHSNMTTGKMICVLSHLQLFATPWTIASQAPLSMEFSRQEYWSGLPLPSSGDPAIEPGSPALQADSLSLVLPGKPIHSSIGGQMFPTFLYHKKYCNEHVSSYICVKICLARVALNGTDGS